MVEFKKIRLELANQRQIGASFFEQINISKNQYSNLNILEEIEKDAELFKNQELYNKINDVQRERLEPINELSRKIIVLGGTDKSFYSQS